jgi:hypothetical protein
VTPWRAFAFTGRWQPEDALGQQLDAGELKLALAAQSLA